MYLNVHKFNKSHTYTRKDNSYSAPLFLVQTHNNTSRSGTREKFLFQWESDSYSSTVGHDMFIWELNILGGVIPFLFPLIGFFLACYGPPYLITYHTVGYAVLYVRKESTIVSICWWLKEKLFMVFHIWYSRIRHPWSMVTVNKSYQTYLKVLSLKQCTTPSNKQI